MKKNRLVGLLLSIMTFGASVLTGCGLISINRHNYLYETVASVVEKDSNTKLKVYKKDLISAYDSYGYYYTQYYGKTVKEAYEETLTLIVNRKITVNEAEKICPIPEGKNGEKERTYLWQKTLDALEDNYTSYLNKLLGTTDSNDEQAADRKFTDYTKKAEFDGTDGKFTIKKLNLPSRQIDDFTYMVPHDASQKADQEVIFANFRAYVNRVDSDTRTKAFNNYFKALKKEEEGLKLSTDMKSVFMREIQRLYSVVYENYMITKYDEYFENHDYDPDYDITISAVTPDQVLELYAKMVKSAYAKYGKVHDSSYESSMQSDPSTIYYYRENGADTKFFQVAHILFKFNDELDDDNLTQSERYKDLQTKLENGYYGDPENDYQDDYDAIIASINPIVRKKNLNGEYVETKATETYESDALTLARYIKKDIDTRTNLFDDNENDIDEAYKGKISMFREYIYRYNDDPGQISNMSGNTNYTIGVNTAEAAEGDKYKIYSSYVEEFTDAAIKLYENGEIGAVSDPVITENGVHVLFYLGEMQNLFNNINENFSLSIDEKTGDYSAIQKLSTSYPNLFVNKSYFDIVYEKLETDALASSFQERNLNALRAKYVITHYASAYKDLVK